MKKIIAAAALSVSTLANAGPNVIASFSSDELEQFFLKRKYGEAIVIAAEKMYGNAADDITIAVFGSYGLVENGTRCVYSINTLAGREYNGFFIVDKSNPQNASSIGTQSNKNNNCSLAVAESFDYVAKSAVESLSKLINQKKQIPQTNPKTYRTL